MQKYDIFFVKCANKEKCCEKSSILCAVYFKKQQKIMKKFKIILLFLCSSYHVFAQTNFLPEAYSTNWNNAGVQNGIPCSASNVIDVTGLGISSSLLDNAPIFQQLLNSSINAQIFYFPVGTYHFASVIYVPSNTIIRGAGIGTVFDFTSNQAFVLQGSDAGAYRDVIWGKQKGSTQFGIGDVSGYQIGQFIEIYQANIAAKMQTNFPSNWNQTWANDAVGMLAKVVSIDNSINSITIDRPLKIDFSDDGGQGYVRLKNLNVVQNTGFENFKLMHQNTATGFNFYLNKTANCWFAGIESAWAVNRHISLEQSANITVTGSHIHDAHNFNGGFAYGVEASLHTTDCLIENNSFNNLRHAMMVHLGANGNVFAHNYSHDPYMTNNFVQTDISVHGHYPYMNLFEGNVVSKIMTTDWWGPAGEGNTFLRNRVKLANITVFDNTERQNLVANEVLGSNGNIQIDANLQNKTLLHANMVAGAVNYNTEFVYVPVSFFRSQRPTYFMSNNSYPAIGPEIAQNNYVIPAQMRYQNGTPTPIFDACAQANVSLPVDWLSIKAVLKAGDILVTFKTVAEPNNDYFEVEKSTNGVNFTKIAKIEPKGIQNSINEYAFNDENPQYYDTNYYRIKQTDFDGKFSYSKIASVFASKNVQTNIYTDGKQVYVDANNVLPYSVLITDAKGKKIAQSQAQANQNIKISLDKEASGIYFVKIQAGNTQETKKIAIF